MGGREAEMIRGHAAIGSPAGAEAKPARERLAELVAAGARACPGFVAGVGPFPEASGSVQPAALGRDGRSEDHAILASLYLALMSHTTLDLIGSRDCLLIEGPFAEDALFVGALARLRSGQSVYVCEARHDLAYGALRLAMPELSPPSTLTRVEPLAVDLAAYADAWRREAEATRRVA